MRDIAAEDQARLDRIAASDPTAARSFAASDPTDIALELARNRRGPEPAKMVSEADALAAVEQVREDAARERMIADQEANSRVLLAASFNAVVDGHQSPEQVVHSMTTNGVPTDVTQRFLDALGETIHAPDAAQLSESLAFREANSTLSFEQAKLQSAAEDERLRSEAEAKRFENVNAALEPEIADKMRAIGETFRSVGVESPALFTAGIATVDVVARRNAELKQGIMDSMPNASRKRGSDLDREYVADAERERTRLISGNPNVPESERLQRPGETMPGDDGPRARIVKADPRVQQNIERLRIVAPSRVDSGDDSLRAWQGRQ